MHPASTLCGPGADLPRGAGKPKENRIAGDARKKISFEERAMTDLGSDQANQRNADEAGSQNYLPSGMPTVKVARGERRDFIESGQDQR